MAVLQTKALAREILHNLAISPPLKASKCPASPKAAGGDVRGVILPSDPLRAVRCRLGTSAQFTRTGLYWAESGESRTTLANPDGSCSRPGTRNCTDRFI